MASAVHNVSVNTRGYVATTKRTINTLRPRQNGRHFPEDIFKYIFLNENVWFSLKISLKFVPKIPINKIPALVQIMAWRRPGDKPLSELMMVWSPTHVCVTRPQWVKSLCIFYGIYVRACILYGIYVRMCIFHVVYIRTCISYGIHVRTFTFYGIYVSTCIFHGIYVIICIFYGIYVRYVPVIDTSDPSTALTRSGTRYLPQLTTNLDLKQSVVSPRIAYPVNM